MRIVIISLMFLGFMLIILFAPKFMNNCCSRSKGIRDFLTQIGWVDMGRLHLMFAGQFSLLLLTLFFCVYWFITGKEFLADCGWFWNIVERGSLEAVVSVMGVIGVSSIMQV